MKQTTMRAWSALTALVAALSLTVPAFAESEGFSIPDKASASSSSSSSKAASGSVSTSTMLKYAKPYENIPQEFLDEIANKKSYTLSQIKQLAMEYQLPSQYVQRFFKNYFVFRSGNSYEYVPINAKLPKNKYNWSHIKKYSNGEWKYLADGQSKALKGIDVSEFQGQIDWKKVKADGVSFAFIRAGYRGYGTGAVKADSRFHQNMKGALAAGVKVGVYFYSQAATTKEAVEEAQFTLDLIENYKLSYPVVFDMEGPPTASARTSKLTSKQATNVAIAFMNHIEKAGQDTMLYSYTKWLIDRMDLSRLTDYDLWLAQYYEVPYFPYDMKALQYTSKGRVKGIQGNVDLNLWFK